MSNGVIKYKRKDNNGHFVYSYRISDYDAAKILEYISKVPHTLEPTRNSKGQFSKLNPKEQL